MGSSNDRHHAKDVGADIARCRSGRVEQQRDDMFWNTRATAVVGVAFHDCLRARPMHVLIRKLTALHKMGCEEQSALLAAIGPVRTFLRGDDVVSDGSKPGHVAVILSGTACRYKILPGGKRHILSFQHPGDVTDLHGYVLGRIDHGIGALSAAEVGQIPHGRIETLCDRYPELVHVFWRDTMVDTAVLQHWSAGQARTVVERIANLLCETFFRLQVVGLATIGKPMPFGVTQLDLADALGLSLVHVNKTLSALKRQGVIERSTRGFAIRSLNELTRIGRFDSAYLHFDLPQPDESSRAPTSTRPFAFD
jgi:CRP-like cAMP-binding protein